MTKLLQVGNDIFEYPQQGTGQGHGEDATAWAEAVTEAIANFIGPNDILLDTKNISNGTYSNVPGEVVLGSGVIDNLSFDVNLVQHVDVDFLIIREYVRRINLTADNNTIKLDNPNLDGRRKIYASNHGLSQGQEVKLVSYEVGGALPFVDTGAALNELDTYLVDVLDVDRIELRYSTDNQIVDLGTANGVEFAIVEQSLTRVVESGKVYGNYNGSDFVITMESVGDDSLVDLDVSASGQFQYTATPLPEQSFGVITFKAKTIDK